MTKTIREELMEFYPAVYFMQDDRTAENHSAYLKRVDKAEAYHKDSVKEVSEGLIIKRFIMTLPMDIRRSIMKCHAERLGGANE